MLLFMKNVSISLQIDSLILMNCYDLSVFIFLLSLTSCASIFVNKRQAVEFNSEPAGAKVYLNAKYIANTPVKYNIGWRIKCRH